jgi:hypothetical protein
MHKVGVRNNLFSRLQGVVQLTETKFHKMEISSNFPLLLCGHVKKKKKNLFSQKKLKKW